MKSVRSWDGGVAFLDSWERRDGVKDPPTEPVGATLSVPWIADVVRERCGSEDPRYDGKVKDRARLAVRAVVGHKVELGNFVGG